MPRRLFVRLYHWTNLSLDLEQFGKLRVVKVKHVVEIGTAQYQHLVANFDGLRLEPADHEKR